MTAKRTSLYSPHPGFKMEAAYHRNLLERTGKTLDQWVAFAKANGPSGLRPCTAWLMAQHRLTRGYASWIAETIDGIAHSLVSYDPDALVEAMFAEPKAGLRPIYDKLLKLALSLGRDVTASPGKTMVPLYRNRLFARLVPTTRTRIDLRLVLLDSTKPTARLLDISAKSAPAKERVNREIRITSLAEIDDEVKRWMKKAYDLDAD